MHSYMWISTHSYYMNSSQRVGYLLAANKKKWGGGGGGGGRKKEKSQVYFQTKQSILALGKRTVPLS